MRLGGAFEGIGGFGLSAERLGWDLVWSSENDEGCERLLDEKFPWTAHLGDIRNVNARSASQVDVVAGGSPCQGFSIAGLGQGLEDPRSGLFGELMRVSDELDAPWLLWENVPGVLTSNGGEDFANVLAALCGASEPIRLPRHASGRKGRHAGVAFGDRGSVAWRVVDAQFFGVAQRRQRVLAVAHRGDYAWRALFPTLSMDDLAKGESVDLGDAGMILLDDGSKHTGHGPAEPRVVRLEDVLEDEVDPALMLSERAARGLLMRAAVRGRELPDVLDYALHAQAGWDLGWDLEPGEALAFDPTMVTRRTGGTGVGQVPALRSSSWKDPHAVVLRQRQGKPGGGKGPLLSVGRSLTLATGNDQYLFVPGPDRYYVRRLSVTEGERLQGFPDGWTSSLGADSARWRAIGNAVAVPVASWVLSGITEAAYVEALAA
jgi:DNA (cytosine-5)-methyltransferase 1